MPSEARPKKIMEKLNRAQKCSILGPQNLGSKGGPRAPPGSAPEGGTRGTSPSNFFSFSCSFQQIYWQTRMHPSRMRTGPALTILGGGKKLGKKRKKNFRHPLLLWPSGFVAF